MIKIHEREEAAEKDWADRFGSLEERLRDYPQRSANRGAIAVHRVGLELGLRLLPALDPPESSRAESLVAVDEALHLFVFERATQQGREASPQPSDTVATFLDQHQASLELLVETVEREAPILWARDNERLFGPPLNHNDSQRRLARLLLAQFFRQLDASDRPAAVATLEALWRIHEGTRGNLGLRNWLIQLENLQLLAGALRQLPQPASIWRQRLDPRSLRAPILDTFRHYGWLWSQVDDVMRWDRNVNIARRLMGAVAAPYVQLCEIDTVARYKGGLQSLIELDYRCDRDLVAAGLPRDWNVPWWNKMADDVAVNVVDLAERWRRTEFDLEATLKILEWEANGMAFGESGSVVCPDGRWRLQSIGDGRELSFSRELRWKEPQTHVTLPSRFRLDSVQ